MGIIMNILFISVYYLNKNLYLPKSFRYDILRIFCIHIYFLDSSVKSETSLHLFGGKNKNFPIND